MIQPNRWAIFLLMGMFALSVTSPAWAQTKGHTQEAKSAAKKKKTPPKKTPPKKTKKQHAQKKPSVKKNPRAQSGEKKG